MNFGPAIRRARQKKRLTQRQLAEQLGVAESTLCDWELGHAAPRTARLKAICKALDTNVSALVTSAMRAGDTTRRPRKEKAS